jgi:hypothetical protein
LQALPSTKLYTGPSVLNCTFITLLGRQELLSTLTTLQLKHRA